jgi:aryl-alcohol dehydrogenase-like predicted oxidoreductase
MSCPSVLVVHVVEIEYGGLPVKVAVFVMALSIRDGLVSGPLGFGAALLGNMFRELTDEEAATTVDATWQHDTRIFDTAPLYGPGLAEIRLGRQLAEHNGDEYELTTKVGRVERVWCRHQQDWSSEDRYAS